MTDTASRVPTTHRTEYDTPPERTGWTGWVTFAAVMMLVIGTFQIIEGLTAIFRRSYYVVGNDDLLVRVNYTGWGWVHLIIGAIIVCAGFALLAGQMWARVIGVIVASLSALVNLAFIEAYPLWAIVLIALDVFVIYAITVHGREMAS